MTYDVVFKGMRDGLLVMLPDAPVDHALAAMIDKMEQNRAFFEGGTCPVYISGELDEWTLDQLRGLLRDEFGLPKVECVGKRAAQELTKPDYTGRAGVVKEHECYALTIEGVIRNGQRVTYQGDLIVLGDANPGSQLVAGGNVLVFGTLRGTAHAGALGDQTACIIALQMQPTQLRIAQHIARPPEDARRRDCPEIASVLDGQIVINPYQPSKANREAVR